jgi:hypothetical protein
VTEHVADDTWEQLAMGELDPAARAGALRHAMACPRCRAIYRGVRALGDGARAQGLVPPPRRSPFRAWLVGAGVAAAAAAAVAVIWVRDPDRGARTTRGDGSAAEIVVDAARTRAGDPLTWSAIAGAAEYRVEVFSGDGRPAWHGRAPAPAIAWPALAPGAYRIRIEAVAGDGRSLARSRLVAVEVAP